MQTRREFLISTAVAAAGGALASGALSRVALAEPGAAPVSKQLDILVLGGTGFIGPYFVRYAVARGHRITTFTRGRHTAELPDSVIQLQGDRNGQLGALEGKRWDACADDSGNVADWVRQSTALLASSVGRYLFTSSTGVYYPYSAYRSRPIDESMPVHTDRRDANDPSEKFGVMKAQGEHAVLDTFGDRGIVVRPTYIIGPNDPSDRFPYWPQRLAKGGEVLAPGRPDDPVQFIDVRDLAAFMVLLLEHNQGGAFNAVGPAKPMTARQFYEAARAALAVDVTYAFVDDYDFLAAQKIDEAIPWALLRGNDDGMMSISGAKAAAAGLTMRPVEATIRDTLDWWTTVPSARRDKPRFTISPDMERAALADWHARRR